MYKCTDNTQSNFLSFNQPLGLHMNPENRNLCKLHGIRLSGPKLGRPSLTKQSAKERFDKNQTLRYNSYINRVICICDESFQNSVTNTFCTIFNLEADRYFIC